MKSLTGGDTVTARFMKKDFFSFHPTFKLWLATNHKPRIRGTDYAIWRRIKLIPFTLTIPDEEQDPTLGETLKAEAPGILRWCVEGCLAWQHEGLAEPYPVLQATATYRQEQDVLGAFLAERCIFEPNAWASAKELFEEYKTWCESGGEKAILNKREFGLALKERGLQDRRIFKGRGWQGLRVLLVGEPEPDLQEEVHNVGNLD